MRRASFLALLLALACGNKGDGREGTPREQALGGQLVARVGGEVISRELLRDAARARGVSPDVILGELVDDAVLAEAARRRGLDQGASTRRSQRAALSRAVVLRLRELGRNAGRPTDEEVKAASIERWKEVDVPESVRVVHAIVLRPKEGDPENAKKTQTAKSLGDALLGLVREAPSAEEFEARAKTLVVPKGLEVRAEKLPLFAADGQIVERGTDSRMDETFARAAFALKTPGAQTGIVETPFGFHVIRLVERVPGFAMPFEERRNLFEADIYLHRMRGAYEAILRERSKDLAIEIAGNADDAMKRVPLEP